MRRAIFLDRDGTINEEVDVLRDVAQLRLLPRVGAAIATLKARGFFVVMVTNQPVIARGWLSPREVEDIHEELQRRLSRDGGDVDAIYYCPHHPNANLPEYRLACECRKPNIGMIKAAASEHDIDLSKSFMIGDSTSDILAGSRAGLTTILVKTGYAGRDGKYDATPDHVAKDLLDCISICS